MTDLDREGLEAAAEIVDYSFGSGGPAVLQKQRRDRARRVAEDAIRAYLSSSQPLTDEDIEALLLAKSECHSIATASPDQEEIVADFQDMARNAWEQLQKVTAKLSGGTG